MGVPKKKRTPGQRKRRASHFALKPVQLVQDGKNQSVPQRYKKTHAKTKASRDRVKSAPRQAAKKTKS